jgi:hypothetical protein
MISNRIFYLGVGVIVFGDDAVVVLMLGRPLGGSVAVCGVAVLIVPCHVGGEVLGRLCQLRVHLHLVPVLSNAELIGFIDNYFCHDRRSGRLRFGGRT